MITRNEIPILEYDDSSLEVIPPDHDWTAGKLPEKCFFAFLGDVVHKYAKAHDATAAETLITVSYDITIYVLHEDGEDICLVQSPIGAPAAAYRRTGGSAGFGHSCKLWMQQSNRSRILRSTGRYCRECFYCSQEGSQG